MESSDGRLKSILSMIKSRDIVTAEEKLELILKNFGITESQLDRTISENPEVMRTVKGHVAETAIDYIFESTGAEIKSVGGDTNVDRIINNKDVQIKTPYKNGTNLGKGLVSYKCHKTHGAKSEKEGEEYYEKASEYPEIIIGLVSLSPLRLLVLNNDEIPRHRIFSERLLSPFKVEFNKHLGMNNFARLDITPPDDIANILMTENPRFLPLTADKVGNNLGLGQPLKPEIILETILKEENFRIWDMSIRGFLRETVFNDWLIKGGSKIHPADLYKRNRWNKTDGLLINKDNIQKYIQMKGLSVNNCNFLSGNIAVEVQLSRGRINDHETQSRMYLKSAPLFDASLGPDFDFLIIAIEPPLTKMVFGTHEWSFYSIPVQELLSHPKFEHRIKPIQKFSKTLLEKYRIYSTWFSEWPGDMHID